ncbi:hypothetical protein evm_007983 [Chilo suppressalis]|nr:hypothetical protein evm_007983 [Chilo suppressalis]
MALDNRYLLIIIVLFCSLKYNTANDLKLLNITLIANHVYPKNITVQENENKTRLDNTSDNYIKGSFNYTKVDDQINRIFQENPIIWENHPGLNKSSLKGDNNNVSSDVLWALTQNSTTDSNAKIKDGVNSSENLTKHEALITISDKENENTGKREIVQNSTLKKEEFIDVETTLDELKKHHDIGFSSEEKSTKKAVNIYKNPSQKKYALEDFLKYLKIRDLIKNLHNLEQKLISNPKDNLILTKSTVSTNENYKIVSEDFLQREWYSKYYKYKSKQRGPIMKRTERPRRNSGFSVSN